MFAFSSRTEVNKQFKLSDLFRQMGASKEAKRDAAGIERITLKNVLSPTTLYCEADQEIKEIYVFEIVVSSRYVPEVFIKELDNSIKLHTLFHIRNGEYEFSMISYKLGGEKGKYHTTNWERNDIPVPPVQNVSELYKFILSKFLQYSPWESETVGEYIKRYNQIVKLDTQISKTTSAIAKESQSKRKFEYNAKLKEYKAEREKLL
jgi:hypothetical protein